VPEGWWEYMTKEEEPTPGPERDTVYVPGNPGGQWTNEEVDATRMRVFQMIHPDFDVKKAQGTWNGFGSTTEIGQTTENTLMRLVFHDCMRYHDGTGGCDGCINFKGVGHVGPSPHKEEDYYRFPAINETDNNGMDQIALKLEQIYTTIDWPFRNASMTVSLFQSGKSRADLWQLAALVALERTTERANRACDLDYHARQQVTLLESREKCEIKLTKPLKFLVGRRDCISEDPLGRAYVTTKPEVQNIMFGDAKHLIDFGRTSFGMDALHWTAVQGIHGVVHSPKNLGIKYTWFGSGYLSNMYFKVLANKPRYFFDQGGDLSFGANTFNQGIVKHARGDPDGNPVAQSGWRVSCMMAWNTTEGGPCVLRPIPGLAADAPNVDKMSAKCVDGYDTNGTCIMTPYGARRCGNAYCDEDNILRGALLDGGDQKVEGPWHPNATDQRYRHSSGWNNQFAFPWEVGMYWDFTTSRAAGQRPVGCPGLNTPLGNVNPNLGEVKPNWPYRTNKSPIFGSPAMNCSRNQYAPEGKPMYQIVEELAEDNEYFIETFLEAWQQFTSNGYNGFNGAEELAEGPASGWLGHHSLAKQGVNIQDFEEYIAANKPVTFTDPTADPYICGHRGHAGTSCGLRFSTGYNAGVFEGNGEGPGIQ